jgi:signal transduction histidine kinase/CheY-like chemotaxis protein/HPt (histidine-containing phosphotransfer) domain-containing protein
VATLVSVPLLVVGVISVIFAHIFLWHEEKSRLTISIFWMGISCAVWCIAYALMGLSSMEIAPIHRCIGSIAVHTYLLAFCIFFMLAAKLRVPRAAKRNWVIFLVIFTVVDSITYGQAKNITFSMIDGRVCYYPNPTPERYIHYIYIAVCVVYLYITGAFWWRRAKFERERRLILSILVSGILMIGCSCFDTFLDRCSLPTSGYGAFIAYIIITMMSMKQNAFSISVQKLGKYIFHSAGVSVLILDDEGRVKLSNASAQKYVSPQGVRDKMTAFFDIAEAEYASFFVGDRAESEWQINAVTRDGLRYCRLDFTVVRDTYGEPYCTICFIDDITREKQMIEELRQAKDEKQKESEALIIARNAAETANRSKTTFLANMSHEIRTPLNSVLGMDEMILRESKEEATLVYATNIQRAGRTLLSLINDILDFSKIESGKLEIVPVNYQLSSLINDTVNMIRPRAVAKGLELRVEADPQLPTTLFGDEVRIRQIIMNLLTNAVKYTDSGSVVFKLDFERVNSQNAELYVNFELILLRISVRDTGHGIRKEDIDKLFDTFERVELKRNRNIEGTGLGLAITKQLVGLMNGKIEVQSEFGKGSNFTVTIPQKVTDKRPIGDFSARLDRHTNVDNRSYRASFTAPEAKILVVDDNEMNLMVVQGLLEPTGVQVETAQSGAQAVEKASQTCYDLILLDHMMPEMDGVETLRQIRRKGCSADAPVIALTANAVSGSREMYLKLGFNDYLSKPIAGSTLEKILTQWLPAERIFAVAVSGPAAQLPDAAAAGVPQSEGLPAEISLEKALSYTTNGVGGVYANCRLYLDNAPVVKKNLSESFARKDYKDYGIYAHSLKSTSAIIGAESISDMAKKMEFAAKEGDFSYIETHHDELMEHYADFTELLASACTKPETAAADISEDEASAQIAKNLYRLQRAAEQYDTVGVSERLDTLSEIPYDDACFKDLLADLRSAVGAFDYDRVVSLVKQNIDDYF